MTKEWVRKGCVVGFVSDKGLMLDLDDMTFKKAVHMAESLMKKHRLEGYLLIRSSRLNYHVVFNRYLTWKKILQIVFSQYVCIRWGIHQARKGELTLRISEKNGKDKPKIVLKKGKEDRLIREYLELYSLYDKFAKELQ